MQPVNELETDEKTTHFLVEITEGILTGMLLLLGITAALILVIYGLDEKRTVRRESEAVTREVIINNGREKEVYELKIYPQEYTKEEFDRLADKLETELNEYFQSVHLKVEMLSKGIILPTEDSTGSLELQWDSDKPAVLSTTGEVKPDPEKPVSVLLTAKVTDGVHSRELSYGLEIPPLKEQIAWFEQIGGELQRLECESRTEREFDIPEWIGDNRIETEQKKERIKMICTGFLMGLFVLVLEWFVKLSRLSEKAERREKEIRSRYYRFVSRLTLLLGAGMSMKGAVERAAQNSGALSEEIAICMNEIKAGISEKKAYERLGKNLMLSEYSQLFSIVSRNLKYGNKNVLELLIRELEEAEKRGREEVRRNGEVISEKMMAPLFLLLITVIGIVMLPAFFQVGL